MDAGASRLDKGATTPPQIIQFSTSAVEERHRSQLIGDVMAQDIVSGSVLPLDGMQIKCDWSLAIVGPGTVITTGAQSGMSAQRSGAMLRDGDGDVSIFLGRRGITRFDQNDRRESLMSAEALVIVHARPVAIEWPDSDLMVLRLPRSAFPAGAPIERAGGVRLAASTAAVALLNSYVDAVWSLAVGGGVPSVAERHLGELATLVLAAAAGQDVLTLARGRAAQTARFAAMREYVARHYANPGLTMAHTAAAVGLSERAGYLVFAAAGAGFTELLFGLRIDRAREMLAAGYRGRLLDLAYAVGFSDLSHFNRRFRAQCGLAPSDFRREAAVCR